MFDSISPPTTRPQLHDDPATIPIHIIANPTAGKFTAEIIARQLAEYLEGRGSLYLTDPDPQARLEGIVGGIRAHQPSLEKPLTVVVMGGDGTFNEGTRGVVTYLFGSVAEFAAVSQRDPVRAADILWRGGIQLCALPFGTACDVPGMYGSQSDMIGSILRSIEDANLSPLNWGAAFLDGEMQPRLFSHGLSFGTVATRMFEETAEARGNQNLRRALIGLRAGFEQDHFLVEWTAPDGVTREEPLVEVLAHTVAMNGGFNGIPGVPAEGGFGVKIAPFTGMVDNHVGQFQSFVSTLAVAGEMALRGIAASKFGDVKLLRAQGRIRMLPERYQPQVGVGQSMSFEVHGRDGVPLQLGGDYLRQVSRVKLVGLPSYPHQLTVPGALIERLAKVNQGGRKWTGWTGWTNAKPR